jgi:acyl-CoA thioesterase-1
MCLLFLVLAFALFSSVSMAQTKRILLLGDSLSAGYGIDIAQSWPVLLQQKMDAENQQAQVINVSISGQTSIEGLSQIQGLINDHKPDLLVLELGANDGLRGLSLVEMKQNLAAIIQTAQSKQVSVLLLGMRIPSNYGRRYTQMFYATFGQLAEEYQTHYVPFMLEPLLTQLANAKTIEMKKGLIQEDGLHPTAAAQPLIVEHLWLPIVKSLSSNTSM